MHNWDRMIKKVTHAHTHPFNGPFSRTTRVSRYQKGKTNLDFTEARGSEWQWHQLGHMQVCTSLQTDNHASTPPLKVFLQTGCPSCRPTNSVKALKAHQSTEGTIIPSSQLCEYMIMWISSSCLFDIVAKHSCLVFCLCLSVLCTSARLVAVLACLPLIVRSWAVPWLYTYVDCRTALQHFKMWTAGWISICMCS